MHTSLGVRITIWSIFISAIVISVGASLANLYERLWWFDEAVHCYSFFAFTLLVATLLYGRTLTGRNQHPVLLLLTIICIGVALGALWEIIEWSYDLIRAGDIIKGKRDTMIDLGFDTIGALVAGIFVLGIAKDNINKDQ